MGNGAEPVGTNAFELALGVLAGLAGLALAVEEVPLAVEEAPLDGGTELLAEALHPARAATAATASAARADPNLLIIMPRSVKCPLCEVPAL
ncbi:MAG: hypothetical protein ABSA53_07870 [Streptosporangiaceae bacterium]|jgi:hypothetical protein